MVYEGKKRIKHIPGVLHTLYKDKSSAFALSFPIFVNTTVDKVRLNEFMSVRVIKMDIY